jgi:hypothetical protein
MNLTKTTFFLSITLFLSFNSFAGGIRGTIKNTRGEVLPFASIIVKSTQKGTMANEDGKYEMTLQSGSYEIIFQYLGHKTITKSVEVKEAFVTLDPVLEEQSVSIGEVKFSAKGEDAALTIMRKTISMARFKILEINNYTARTYVKGTGQVSEVSSLMKFIAGKKIEKETGIKIGQVYVLESINDINFKQPSSVNEKVVSARNNLPKQLKDAGGDFLSSSRVNIYNPKPFGDMISPLSPVALSYYKFKYEGFFLENGLTINKIRVVPKSKNDNVFEGTINIIEDSWYIHSLDLKFKNDDNLSSIKMIFAPNQEIWLPVSYSYRLDFDQLGFKGFFNYVTNIRNYNISVNSKYHQKPVVIDEKIDKIEAQALKSEKIDAKIALKQKQLTRKQLGKFLKEAEKEDKKERKEKGEDVALVRSYNMEVDSLYRKKPNDFWNEERQVPLTELEIKGYAQADSLDKANEGNFKKDSIKSLPKFKFMQIIEGKTYNYGIRDNFYGFYNQSLTYSSPITQSIGTGFVNSVDGYFLQASLNYETRLKNIKRTNLYADFKYALGREAFNWKLGYFYLKNQHSYQVQTGRFIQQYNSNNPIQNAANLVYTMLLEENYLKIYEKDFIDFTYRNRFSEKITLSSNIEFSNRKQLQNLEGFKPWIDSKEKEFSSNVPQNLEMPDAKFQTHNTLIADIDLIWRPFAKKQKYNNREYTINTGNPFLKLKTVTGLLSESSFSRLQGSFEQFFELEKLGDLHFLANYGGFLKKPDYFIDYRHFNGNQTILRSFRFDAFRNLNYYLHSTTGNYLEVFAQNDFPKFLLTQITPLRVYGLKESIFANYLNVAKQDFNYIEVGYGLTGIGKLFGLEVVGSFVNGKYDATVLRVKFNK